jgi:hypothetical protein
VGETEGEGAGVVIEGDGLGMGLEEVGVGVGAVASLPEQAASSVTTRSARMVRRVPGTRVIVGAPAMPPGEAAVAPARIRP